MDSITIATLGSHSALDICRGAKDEGFKTLVICQKGREKTYGHHFKTNHSTGIVDDTLLLDSFNQLTDKKIQEQLCNANAIFIPHRSLIAYLNANYAAIETMRVPFFGNRYTLKCEERIGDHNQYKLLQAAGIRVPKIFKNYHDIDRLCIVKLPEKERSFERAFFFCSDADEYATVMDKKIAAHEIDESQINNAVIEEFIIGPYVNFNFFYSPISPRLELLGTDTRRQTNIDGFLHLNAHQQIALKQFAPKFEEAGHIAVTVVESMLEHAFELGQQLIDTAKKMYAPGIVGPFALQSAIIPGPPKKDIVVFDLSVRIPGSPGIMFTPYTYYLHGQQLSTGRRIAMEIKHAAAQNRLHEILT